MNSAENFLRERSSTYTEWRRVLHQWPETAFAEHRTASYLSERLKSMGIKVHTGIAGTGLVATIEGRQPGGKVGLRADMDALPIQELGTPEHRSRNDGVMHACGHDGHMAMLLAAADYLSTNRNFAGQVHLIFQPAEEAEGGGRKMVEEGLFERWPVDVVFGLHNWPGLPLGQVAVREGAMMAAMDLFTIKVNGAGVHAAQPHLGTDSIVAASAVVTSLQTIVSRAIDPLQPVVVSLTQIHGGHSLNALPAEVVLHGTVRSLSDEARAVVQHRLSEIVAGVALCHGVEAALEFTPRYPATMNHGGAVRCACRAATAINGRQPVLTDFKPSMTSEDFAFMLNARPGCYSWIGDGRDVPLHSPMFDFNDALTPLGAGYLVSLALTALASKQYTDGDASGQR